MPIELDSTEEIFASSQDLTVGLEEEFAVLDPQTLDLVPRFEELRAAAAERDPILFGAGHLGQAIASSDIFADHGFRVVAIFDNDKRKIGQQVGPATVRPSSDLKAVVEDEDIVVGVLAVPTGAAQPIADDLVEAGVKIIFNYSEALLQVPPEVTVHTSSPAVDLLYALYFYLT